MEIMQSSRFIVLEYDLLACELLNNTDKILYGWIVALSQKNINGCFAKTSKLAELVGLKERQIFYSLDRLKKYNFISINKIKEDNKIVRYIKPTINEFIEFRDKNNKKKNKRELIEYDWLNEEE